MEIQNKIFQILLKEQNSIAVITNPSDLMHLPFPPALTFSVPTAKAYHLHFKIVYDLISKVSEFFFREEAWRGHSTNKTVLGFVSQGHERKKIV